MKIFSLKSFLNNIKAVFPKLLFILKRRTSHCFCKQTILIILELSENTKLFQETFYSKIRKVLHKKKEKKLRRVKYFHNFSVLLATVFYLFVKKSKRKTLFLSFGICSNTGNKTSALFIEFLRCFFV